MSVHGSHRTQRETLWQLAPGARRLLLLAPPLLFAGFTILHPQPDQNTQALMDASTWFMAYHMIQLPLLGLVAVSVIVFADEFRRAGAWPTWIGMGAFLIFFSAYDTLAGIGTGLAMRSARDLTPRSRTPCSRSSRTGRPWIRGCSGSCRRDPRVAPGGRLSGPAGADHGSLRRAFGVAPPRSRRSRIMACSTREPRALRRPALSAVPPRVVRRRVGAEAAFLGRGGGRHPGRSPRDQIAVGAWATPVRVGADVTARVRRPLTAPTR